MDLARVGDRYFAAVLAAGFPVTVPSVTIERKCGSGQQAVDFAVQGVASGAYDIVIAGGVESMSRVGMGMSGGAWLMDPSVGLPSYFVPQGVSADLMATKYGFSRDDVDAYAVEVSSAETGGRLVFGADSRPAPELVACARDADAYSISTRSWRRAAVTSSRRWRATAASACDEIEATTVLVASDSASRASRSRSAGASFPASILAKKAF